MQQHPDVVRAAARVPKRQRAPHVLRSGAQHQRRLLDAGGSAMAAPSVERRRRCSVYWPEVEGGDVHRDEEEVRLRWGGGTEARVEEPFVQRNLHRVERALHQLRGAVNVGLAVRRGVHPPVLQQRRRELGGHLVHVDPQRRPRRRRRHALLFLPQRRQTRQPPPRRRRRLRAKRERRRQRRRLLLLLLVLLLVRRRRLQREGAVDTKPPWLTPAEASVAAPSAAAVAQAEGRLWHLAKRAAPALGARGAVSALVAAQGRPARRVGRREHPLPPPPPAASLRARRRLEDGGRVELRRAVPSHAFREEGSPAAGARLGGEGRVARPRVVHERPRLGPLAAPAVAARLLVEPGPRAIRPPHRQRRSAVGQPRSRVDRGCAAIGKRALERRAQPGAVTVAAVLVAVASAQASRAGHVARPRRTDFAPAASPARGAAALVEGGAVDAVAVAGGG
mmetsp:Transcript_23827/g.76447  ORF Transcript_23827/g.76447 Transcript_23827/m.76447 type:complete len:450 (+) Transcript_23827:1293-2642(+)